ncbi:MAG: HIRAN domain-containing protein [Acidobacteriota bacterium]
MDHDRRHATLSKADRGTPAGRELIALLTELSADGHVTSDEMTQLRAWLEVDRGVDFPACAFLHGVVETISEDGESTEEELDRLALAIERVLPPDVRAAAALKRKEHRAARRQEVAAKRDAGRTQARAARMQARELAKPLHRGDFMVMGAVRSAERRDGCASLDVGEAVVLEREPDNPHDGNAILVLTQGGIELGYVPRELAKQMAPLLDGGADVEATVKKLLTAAEGYTLPVVISTLRRVETSSAESSRPPALATHSAPIMSHPIAHRSPADVLLQSDVVSPTSRVGRWIVVAWVVALTLAVAGFCAR